LALRGYYRKFVEHYGELSNPLMKLLSKNAFHWTLTTERAFTNLKQAMCNAPVLATPDFKKMFDVE
jgi:hypothetical protein